MWFYEYKRVNMRAYEVNTSVRIGPKSDFLHSHNYGDFNIAV